MKYVVCALVFVLMLTAACGGRSAAAQPTAASGSGSGSAPTNAPAAPTTAATGAPAATSAAAQPTDTQAAEGQATETPTALPGPVKAKLGERAVLPGIALTVTKVEQSNGNDAYQPQEGNKFLIVHVTFENTSNQRLDVNNGQFEFEDSSGVVYNSLENPFNGIDQVVTNKFDHYTLTPGGKLQDKTIIIQLKPDQMQGLQLLFTLDDQNSIQVDLGL